MTDLTLKKFDSELHRQIKIQAAIEGITIKALIDKALWEYLERAEPQWRKLKEDK